MGIIEGLEGFASLVRSVRAIAGANRKVNRVKLIADPDTGEQHQNGTNAFYSEIVVNTSFVSVIPFSKSIWCFSSSMIFCKYLRATGSSTKGFKTS